MSAVNLSCGRIAEIVFTIWVGYSVYANLIEHRLTKIGFDGLIIGFIGLMAGKGIAEQARKDPRVVKRMAMLMSLVVVGGIWDIVMLFIRHG